MSKPILPPRMGNAPAGYLTTTQLNFLKYAMTGVVTPDVNPAPGERLFEMYVEGLPLGFDREEWSWSNIHQDFRIAWEALGKQVFGVEHLDFKKLKPFLRHAPSCSALGECSCGFATIELELGLL